LLADRSRTCCAASARACRRSCCPTYRRSGPPRLNRGQASLFGEVTPCVPPEPAAGQPGNTRSGSGSSRGSRRWRPVGRRSPTTPRPSACAGAAQHARADRVPAGPAVQHSAPRIQRAGRPGPGALAAGRGKWGRTSSRASSSPSGAIAAVASRVMTGTLCGGYYDLPPESQWTARAVSAAQHGQETAADFARLCAERA
jgi:hypothetical protein